MNFFISNELCTLVQYAGFVRYCNTALSLFKTYFESYCNTVLYVISRWFRTLIVNSVLRICVQNTWYSITPSYTGWRCCAVLFTSCTVARNVPQRVYPNAESTSQIVHPNYGTYKSMLLIHLYSLVSSPVLCYLNICFLYLIHYIIIMITRDQCSRR